MLRFPPFFSVLIKKRSALVGGYTKNILIKILLCILSNANSIIKILKVCGGGYFMKTFLDEFMMPKKGRVALQHE